MKSRAGFTLAELLIALALMGIVTFIAINQILKMLPNMRLRAAVRELYGQMQNTKMKAIKNNCDWAIVFDPENKRYLVCSSKGPDGSWSTTADNTIATPIYLSAHGNGIRFGHGLIDGPHSVSHSLFPAEEVSYLHKVLVFNPMGTSSSGYVYLENEEYRQTYAVGTLASGSIRILSWTGSTWR